MFVVYFLFIAIPQEKFKAWNKSDTNMGGLGGGLHDYQMLELIMENLNRQAGCSLSSYCREVNCHIQLEMEWMQIGVDEELPFYRKSFVLIV
mmetsp:Transcript_12834/g.22059  ORF Transcript_12834/g.22059 Transcript_12834/m.22059 type:complete len:92 (+) Transcript_12834:80-355(+)